MNKHNKTYKVIMTHSMNFNIAFSKLPNHNYMLSISDAEATLMCYKDKTATFMIDNNELSFSYRGIVESLNAEEGEEIDTLEIEMKLPNDEGYVSIEGVGKMDYISSK